MNTQEWIMYKHVLYDYLAGPEGLALSAERRETFYEELDRVQYKINGLMCVWNTNESVISNYNPENEINNF